MLLGSADTTGV